MQNANQLIPTDYYNRVQSSVNTKLGTIVYKGNVFYLLNWFGQPIWSVDLYKELRSKDMAREGGAVNWMSDLYLGLVWVNYVYDPVRDKLDILTLVTQPFVKKYSHQYIITINATTGELGIVVNLKPNNLNKINTTNSQINYPEIFSAVYFGFQLSSEINYHFSLINQDELRPDIDIKNLTTQYIFNHQNLFINQNSERKKR